MPSVRLTRAAHDRFRRTLKSGRRYTFVAGRIEDVAEADLAELLASSSGVLEQVEAERRGGKVRRWRPIAERTKKRRSRGARREQPPASAGPAAN